MRTLLRFMALASLIVAGAFAVTASAHTLKLPRASRANKADSKSFCASVVNDPNLGTCIASKGGPCRRLSAHRVRCVQEQTFEEANGTQFVCGAEFDWYYKGRLSILYRRLIESATTCTQIRGPTAPPPPAG